MVLSQKIQNIYLIKLNAKTPKKLILDFKTLVNYNTHAVYYRIFKISMTNL